MLAAAFVCSEARAGAWPTPRGQTLAILKFEHAAADEAYDIDGDRYEAAERRDDAVSLYVEHGLTDRITLQGKFAWTDGNDGLKDYGGRGPLELGVRYRLYQDDHTAMALYMGGVVAGEGRNAGYADPGVGGADAEIRLLAGRSFRLAGRPAFAEIQLARLDRQDLSDETRLDATLGLEPRPEWLLMLQTYSGRAESGAAWTKLEAAAVRRFGAWRAQAGWRVSIAGKAGPAEAGPVLGLWRTF